MALHLTGKEKKDVKKIAEISRFLDGTGPVDLAKEADVIYQYQPFILTLFMGFRQDVNIMQLDELFRIMLGIWLFFRERKGIRSQQITEAQFEEKMKGHTAFLSMLSRTPPEKLKELTEADLSGLQSKTLFSFAFFRVLQGPALGKLPLPKAGIILSGILSLISLLEERFPEEDK